MNINIMDYDDNSYDTGIPVEDVKTVFVTVVSGDEILHIIKNDGETVALDAMDFTDDIRRMCFLDEQYVLNTTADITEWMKRKNSYDYDYVTGKVEE